MKPVDAEKRAIQDANAQARGRAAEGLLEGVQSALRFRREAYITALLTKTRAKGEVADQEVWKLMALDDFEKDLKHDIAIGVRATERQQRRIEDDSPAA